MDRPNNLDLQAPNTFQLVFAKLPEIIYRVQRVDMPGVSLGTVPVYTGPNTQHDFTVPGEKLTYDPINMGILLDEDFDSYIEVLNWMRECTTSKGVGRATGEPLKAMSDATLIMQTNKFNPNKRLVLYDIFPIQLGAISLDYTIDPSSPLVYDVTFNFRTYEFVNI